MAHEERKEHVDRSSTVDPYAKSVVTLDHNSLALHSLATTSQEVQGGFGWYKCS